MTENKTRYAESVRVAVAVMSAMTDDNGEFVEDGTRLSIGVRESFVDEYGEGFVLDGLQNLAFILVGNHAKRIGDTPRELLRKVAQVVTEIEGQQGSG